MSLSPFTVSNYSKTLKKLKICRISPFLPQRLTPREAELHSESFLVCLEQNKGNLIILCLLGPAETAWHLQEGWSFQWDQRRFACGPPLSAPIESFPHWLRLPLPWSLPEWTPLRFSSHVFLPSALTSPAFDGHILYLR